MAFGDGHNDVEMLRAAKLGVAVANASAAAKEAAPAPGPAAVAAPSSARVITEPSAQYKESPLSMALLNSVAPPPAAVAPPPSSARE